MVFVRGRRRFQPAEHETTRLVVRRRYISAYVHYCVISAAPIVVIFLRSFVGDQPLQTHIPFSPPTPVTFVFRAKDSHCLLHPSWFFSFPPLYYNIIIACRVRLSRTSFVVARPVFSCVSGVRFSFIPYRRRYIGYAAPRTWASPEKKTIKDFRSCEGARAIAGGGRARRSKTSGMRRRAPRHLRAGSW